MAAKLIIHVFPDDRVQVKVEGLPATDAVKPQAERVCRKVTRRLEEDLGLVEHRDHEGDAKTDIQASEQDGLSLGNG